jgi:transcriptional regulator with XRE-family HTH domain
MKSSGSVESRLKQAREIAGVTLNELAKRTGYALPTLSGVENGHDRASKRLLEKWIDALQLEKAWVESGTGEVFLKMPALSDRTAADSTLATPLRSRIRKARQLAASLLQKLEELEEEIAGSARNPQVRKRPSKSARPSSR